MGAGASLGLFHAADTGDVLEVSKAVSSGVDVNEKEKSSRQTPLMAACRGGHREVVFILLKAGAFVSQFRSACLRQICTPAYRSWRASPAFLCEG